MGLLYSPVMPQEPPEILAPAVPCGQDSLRTFGGSSVFSTRIF